MNWPAAMEISKMLHFPDATEVEYFNQGKAMIASLALRKLTAK